MLDSKYRVVKAQPVDMFPHTHHVENVVLLEKR
jgi:23S rRNA (uracil1939-C5)-methyltransferase